MSALVRLYPEAWRDRYGQELEDLLTARVVGIGGHVDLIRGAVDAHRHPELVDPTVPDPAAAAPVSRERYEELRLARRLGMGALIGAVAWIGGWVVAANGPLVVDGDTSYRDGAAAMPILLVSMILLSAGLVGQLLRLPGQAIVARMGALVSIVVAPIWALAPWIAGYGLAVLGGLVLLAVSAWWRRAWSLTPAMVILASMLSGLVFAVAPYMGRPPIVAGLDPVVMLPVSFLPLWLVVGGTLLRLPAMIDEDRLAGGSTGQPATA